jgi:hypothetical protein
MSLTPIPDIKKCFGGGSELRCEWAGIQTGLATAGGIEGLAKAATRLAMAGRLASEGRAIQQYVEIMAQLAETADNARGAFQIGSKRNVATALVAVDGIEPRVLTAASGRGDIKGLISPNPSNTPQRYVAGLKKSAREADSEIKILNHVAQLIGPPNSDVKGVINIWTERPPCPSCQSIFSDFVREYPNIYLTVGRGDK